MGHQNRKEMGLLGQKHVAENYSFENFEKQWVKLIDDIVEKKGSWKNRKEYNGIVFKEVA